MVSDGDISVNILMEDEHEIDLFRALGHPLRRRILKLIAERGAVSYKELSKIEPKAGVLYHHLRLLGDLIYQDEKRMYRLTDKGKRAYEFLITAFLVPEDKSIHRFLTPRWLFEIIEGKQALIIMILFLFSCLSWCLEPDYMPVLLVVVPGYKCRIIQPFLLPVINLVSTAIVTKMLVRLIHGRTISLRFLVVRMAPGCMIMNIFPLVLMMGNPYIEIVSYFLMQFFAILLIVSALSVEARLPLKSSALIIIVIHYMSVLATLALIYTHST